ncbi:B3/B4 domain-containing protein [Fusobacterium sp. THCT1E2]
MKIIIDDMLKNKVESIRLGCIIYDVKVKEKNEELWKKFDREIFPALISLMEDKGINDIENIFLSKKAYKSLGKDPNRYRVSSEALYRRIKQGKGLYQINTVVDTNNLISLETGFSVGSYDLKNIKGDILLRKGRNGEIYKGIGKDDINIENLPVLADNEGAFASPTSDSIKTMVTLESVKILTLIYCFSKNENLDEILEKSFKYLEKYTEAENIEKFIVE